MELIRNAPAKPAKGSGLIARKTRRKDVVAHEDAEKAKVRRRDRVCRWPRCENCRRFKPRLEVAHLTAKGIGGDPRARVTTADRMVLLDYLTHQGSDGLEQHERRIVPLTKTGTDGPCQFWARDEDRRWYLVAEEIAIGMYRRD